MMMTVAMAVVAAVAVAAVPAVGVRLASTSSGACAHACMHRSSSDVELHYMHVDAKLELVVRKRNRPGAIRRDA